MSNHDNLIRLCRQMITRIKRLQTKVRDLEDRFECRRCVYLLEGKCGYEGEVTEGVPNCEKNNH